MVQSLLLLLLLPLNSPFFLLATTCGQDLQSQFQPVVCKDLGHRDAQTWGHQHTQHRLTAKTGLMDELGEADATPLDHHCHLSKLFG